MAEQSPQQEREETLCYLQIERLGWMALRESAADADGPDSHLDGLLAESMHRIDHLLEDLFAQMVMADLVRQS